MNIMVVTEDGVAIAIVQSDESLITDVQSALDLIATVQYETGCDRVAIHKAAVCEDFFDLSSRIAGEILQKFVTYNVKLAIVGDFSIYASKSLRDFIYESNEGRHIFFASSEEQAIEKLSKA